MSRSDCGNVTVIGAGGHAKVVISTLQAAGYSVDAVFDSDSAKWGTTCLGIPVRGGLDELAAAVGAAAVIAIGSNSVRQDIAEQYRNMQWVTVVHPQSFVHPSVRLGAGTVVFAGAVIQPDTVVGDHVIVNTGATVDHDCVVGDYAHLAPGVHLAGRVRVGSGTLLGIGSTVIPGISIGAWTTVGAGAAVVRDLSQGITAVGVPCKPTGGNNQWKS